MVPTLKTLRLLNFIYDLITTLLLQHLILIMPANPPLTTIGEFKLLISTHPLTEGDNTTFENY